MGGKVKTGPLRTCLGCGRKTAKANLMRLVVVDNQVVVDVALKVQGRGAYCCRAAECLRRVRKNARKLARALRSEDAKWSEGFASFINE